MHYPASLQQVMEFLKKLPGVGNKSAERFAFQLLDWDKSQLKEMAHCFHTLHDKLGLCAECGAASPTWGIADFAPKSAKAAA